MNSEDQQRKSREISNQTHLHVVGSGDDPVFAGDEAGASNRKIAHLQDYTISLQIYHPRRVTYLEIFHHLLVLVVHDMNMTVVKSAQHPWLGGMEVH